VDIQLARLGRTLAEKGLALELSREAKELLAREGYDPAFGARPLKRVIQRRVQDRLALGLLKGEFAGARDGKIRGEVKDGEIVFRKK
jgi:ATP-dependent Clp protease ATP-binding subunit ClpB